MGFERLFLQCESSLRAQLISFAHIPCLFAALWVLMHWNIKTANEKEKKRQKGLRITLLFYTYPSHSAPQHTPHWLTEQGAIFHPKSNQPMLSRAVWDNQKGYPDQRPSLYSVQTGLPIRVGELDQNRKGPSSLTDLKTFTFAFVWPLPVAKSLSHNETHYLFLFLYLFLSWIKSQGDHKSQNLWGRTFFGKL